jgi:hypothetical protein
MNDEFGKDLEGRGCGLIEVYYPEICLEAMRKTMKYSVKITRAPANNWRRFFDGC